MMFSTEWLVHQNEQTKQTFGHIKKQNKTWNDQEFNNRSYKIQQKL